jgi:shikimate dehydrogenase
MTDQRSLRLGLIGGNIRESRSPALQIVCGLSVRRNVSYDLLIPAEQGISFSAMLRRCERAGFDGVNVTYPFKEEAASLVTAGTPVVKVLGAANTVHFGPQGARAYNTDHSGFIAAYRERFGGTAPGRVLLLGTGGVGRAIAFALADLGAREILLHDIDQARADTLAAAAKTYAGAAVEIRDADRLADLDGIDGIINCTPLGMTGRPGSALPQNARGRPRWAFDAVYTPEHTPFRAQAEALGARFLSGYELYFHQGVQGFAIFSGVPVSNSAWIRQVLAGLPD